MKYIYGQSKCIQHWKTNEVLRADFETALSLVEGGFWHYTSKGAWKSSGRHYYEQDATT